MSHLDRCVHFPSPLSFAKVRLEKVGGRCADFSTDAGFSQYHLFCIFAGHPTRLWNFLEMTRQTSQPNKAESFLLFATSILIPEAHSRHSQNNVAPFPWFHDLTKERLRTTAFFAHFYASF